MSNPTVTLETTLGTMRAEIFQDKAPATAKNFLTLVQKGFYNGLTFHREAAFHGPGRLPEG